MAVHLEADHRAEFARLPDRVGHELLIDTPALVPLDVVVNSSSQFSHLAIFIITEVDFPPAPRK